MREPAPEVRPTPRRPARPRRRSGALSRAWLPLGVVAAVVAVAAGVYVADRADGPEPAAVTAPPAAAVPQAAPAVTQPPATTQPAATRAAPVAPVEPAPDRPSGDRPAAPPLALAPAAGSPAPPSGTRAPGARLPAGPLPVAPSSAAQPPAAQPPAPQPPAAQPPAQPPAARPPVAQPPAAQPPVARPPAAAQSIATVPAPARTPAPTTRPAPTTTRPAPTTPRPTTPRPTTSRPAAAAPTTTAPRPTSRPTIAAPTTTPRTTPTTVPRTTRPAPAPTASRTPTPTRTPAATRPPSTRAPSTRAPSTRTPSARPARVPGSAGAEPRGGLPWYSGVVGGTPAEVAAFQRFRDRPVDVVHAFAGRRSWAEVVSAGWIMDSYADFDGLLVISQPFWPERSGGSLGACAAGRYDGRWADYGRTLARHGRTDVLTRLAWEFNGDWFEWSATDVGAWKACYRSVVDAVRSTAPAARFEWTLNAHGSQTCGGDAYRCYPGDAHVDVVGIDPYDHYPSSQSEAEFERQCRDRHGLCAAIDFARAHGKRVGVGEWGVISSGIGDNPLYVREMFETFRRAGDVMLYDTWFNSAEHESTLDRRDNPRSAATYRSLFGGG